MERSPAPYQSLYSRHIPQPADTLCCMKPCPIRAILLTGLPLLSVLTPSALAQPPTTEAPGPTLTLAGPLMLAAKVDRAVPLYWREGRQRFAVGHVNPNGTLDLQIDPALRARARVGTLSDWKASHARNCDVQELSVEQDAKIQYLGAPEYDAGGQRYFVRPGTVTKNADDTTLKFLMFVYAENAGRLSGSEKCGTTVITYDMTLQPGWNAVDELQVLRTDDQFGPRMYNNARLMQSYEGPWNSFELQQP